MQTTAAVQATTIYAGKLFEKITVGSADEYRHYIYANGSAVAVMSRASGGGATTRYLLRDHLGSVAKIADGTGAAVVSESFTPFGERRNPATWSGVPVNGELGMSANVTQQGYTGQDGLGSFGLNHMNGRVHDAVTGRFLSADPYITEPGNTQNLNRYSYVENNPLAFTDPSGFCQEGPSIADCMPPYEGGGSQPQSAPPPLPVFAWGDFELANPSGSGIAMEATPQTIRPDRAPIGASTASGNSIGVLYDGVAYTVSHELVGSYLCAKTGQCETRPVVRFDCNVWPEYRDAHCDAVYPSYAIENAILASVSAVSLVRSAVAANTPEAIIGRLAQAHANSGLQALASQMSLKELAAVQGGSRASSAILGQAVHNATAQSLA